MAGTTIAAQGRTRTGASPARLARLSRRAARSPQPAAPTVLPEQALVVLGLVAIPTQDRGVKSGIVTRVTAVMKLESLGGATAFAAIVRS